MSIGNKIVYEINRPDKKLVELFREMPVANIDDNMGRIAAVDAAIPSHEPEPFTGHSLYNPYAAGRQPHVPQSYGYGFALGMSS